MCHVSCVTCHMSRVKCHLSHVKKKFTFFLSLKNFTKWWSYSVESLLSTGPTPSSFYSQSHPCCSSKFRPDISGMYFSLWHFECISDLWNNQKFPFAIVPSPLFFSQLWLSFKLSLSSNRILAWPDRWTLSLFPNTQSTRKESFVQKFVLDNGFVNSFPATAQPQLGFSTI